MRLTHRDGECRQQLVQKGCSCIHLRNDNGRSCLSKAAHKSLRFPESHAPGRMQGEVEWRQIFVRACKPASCSCLFL